MKVSIIIPIYNVAPYIKDCLISVLSQTYKDIEIILVDDCGTDNSMEIVEETINPYKELYDIKIIHHERNKGLSAARNSGIKAATGEYVYFLDSDDTIPSNAIELLVNKIKLYPNVDLVIGGIKTVGISKRQYPLLSKEYLDQEQVFLDYIQFKWPVMACNKLINRSFLLKNNIPFIEGVYHEDMDFSFKLALYATSMACCHDVTYNYLIRENSITTYKTTKHFTDFISIINNNLGLLQGRKTNNIQEYKIISNYIIESLYFACVEVIKEKNPNIGKETKYSLLRQIKQIRKQYNQYDKLDCDKMIKKCLLIMPTPLLFSIINIYAKIRHL